MTKRFRRSEVYKDHEVATDITNLSGARRGWVIKDGEILHTTGVFYGADKHDAAAAACKLWIDQNSKEAARDATRQAGRTRNVGARRSVQKAARRQT